MKNKVLPLDDSGLGVEDTALVKETKMKSVENKVWRTLNETSYQNARASVDARKSIFLDLYFFAHFRGVRYKEKYPSEKR